MASAVSDVAWLSVMLRFEAALANASAPVDRALETYGSEVKDDE
jgi:hypothetical protein